MVDCPTPLMVASSETHISPDGSSAENKPAGQSNSPIAMKTVIVYFMSSWVGEIFGDLKENGFEKRAGKRALTEVREIRIKNGKRSFGDKCVPKQSLGTRRRGIKRKQTPNAQRPIPNRRGCGSRAAAGDHEHEQECLTANESLAAGGEREGKAPLALFPSLPSVTEI